VEPTTLARGKELPLASPEDTFDFDGDVESLDEIEQGSTVRPGVLAMNDPVLRAARRELRWFYTEMHARVPAACEAKVLEVAAASRIAGWLTELEPRHRGAFVVRYDGRRWPARITREFSGLTSVVVRLAAMQRQRGPTETLAEAERAAVTELLADIAAAVAMDPAKKHRRLRRAAQNYVRRAEFAYLDARGHARCAVPPRARHSREGA
jgi:hypothetical protein